MNKYYIFILTNHKKMFSHGNLCKAKNTKLVTFVSLLSDATLDLIYTILDGTSFQILST